MRAYDDFLWTSVDDLARLADQPIPWAYYLATAVHFDAAGSVGAVIPRDDAGGDEDPPLGPLHVVTAVQPELDEDIAEIAARMDVLDRELSDRRIRSMHVVGAAFDGGHRENSRAVFGLSDAEACALGRRFGQVAVFAWNGPRWSLLACATDRRDDRGWRWEPAV